MIISCINEYDENNIRQCELIGSLSLPIYYKHDDLKVLIEKANDIYKIYLAELNNKIVGFAITCFTDEGGTHIMSIAIHPNYRKKKIGTKLIEKIKYDNLDTFISLYVQTNNKSARHFYAKNNFVEVERIKNYYQDLDDNDAYLMVFLEI